MCTVEQSIENAGHTGTGEVSSSHPDISADETSVLSGLGTARPVHSSISLASASTSQLGFTPVGVAFSFIISAAARGMQSTDRLLVL